jgi:coproporphyrinogen III oxidase
VKPKTLTASSLGTRSQELFERLQQSIAGSLERADGRKRFAQDDWTHQPGGGGRTRILEGGHVFEKAGVNTSAVSGTLSDLLAERLNATTREFFAAGISLVLHPYSPMIPTVHMNLRYIELSNGDAWFGGGADLTPYYLFDGDARHFHSTLKNICDTHGKDYYSRFKKSCDEYFFLKHRGESRGIGGIFFDYVRDDLDSFFRFVEELGNGFLETYLPIVERRKDEPFGDREKEWQLIRRGRYVEFNLICDRGTLFGLDTQGRTESILMSLPPTVKWVYNHQLEPDSREENLLKVLQKPREWV